MSVRCACPVPSLDTKAFLKLLHLDLSRASAGRAYCARVAGHESGEAASGAERPVRPRGPGAGAAGADTGTFEIHCGAGPRGVPRNFWTRIGPMRFNLRVWSMGARARPGGRARTRGSAPRCPCASFVRRGRRGWHALPGIQALWRPRAFAAKFWIWPVPGARPGDWWTPDPLAARRVGHRAFRWRAVSPLLRPAGLVRGRKL